MPRPGTLLGFCVTRAPRACYVLDMRTCMCVSLYIFWSIVVLIVRATLRHEKPRTERNASTSLGCHLVLCVLCVRYSRHRLVTFDIYTYSRLVHHTLSCPPIGHRTTRPSSCCPTSSRRGKASKPPSTSPIIPRAPSHGQKKIKNIHVTPPRFAANASE
ncbi:hypothetical protein F4802DRAFT_408049 [Xylaria palmicola]|nr:hypothetical protein F4802DRAFT_408049 [Xylaria palmicola]